ncbi:ABC transporter permease [Nocardioides sp. CBS4Y-1]|uniref:ABC transporter permease n=2 Tax=Nocardioides acrostichi TaxID=2784339 RepID=A0A930V0U1_9ACTN|nr:ABC transporter permease [Nocardioides acrostichi]
MLLPLTFVVFGALTPALFLTTTNIRLTLIAQAIPLLLAMAVTLTLRAGDIDLSVAGVMIASGALTGIASEHGASTLVACAIGLGAALLVGVVNAVFIVAIGLDSLIVTLGVFTALAGFTSWLTGSNLVTTVPQSLQTFSNQPVAGLPVVVWLGWLVALVLWWVFEFTPFGRYLLFIGGNRAAGTLAGLRVDRLRVMCFVAGSLIAGLTGILLAGSLGSVDPSSANAYLLAPITAAFLGTTCIQLGRFNVVGTLVGLYLIAFGITGLQLLGYQGWVTDLFNGVALVVALTFARYFEVMRNGQLKLGRRRAAQRKQRSVEQEAAPTPPSTAGSSHPSE